MERRRLHGRTDLGLREIGADRIGVDRSGVGRSGSERIGAQRRRGRAGWWVIMEAETGGGRAVCLVLATPMPRPQLIEYSEALDPIDIIIIIITCIKMSNVT